MQQPHLRSDLADACARAWTALAGPGTWWTGRERVAIAAEMRCARACALCHERKDELSPNIGTHTATDELPAGVVDAVHRITTDPGRMTPAWVPAAGVDVAACVEMVGVISTVTFVDTLDRAMSAPERPLPAPAAGEPSRELPDGAEVWAAWVPTVPLAKWSGSLLAIFGGAALPPAVANIMLALTLVPAEAAQLVDMMRWSYVHPRLAIAPPQNQLIASTVSAYNQCFY